MHKNRTRAEKDRIIKGYLEFANANLDDIKDPLVWHLWRSKLFLLEANSLNSMDILEEGNCEDLVRYQNQWREILDWIVDNDGTKYIKYKVEDALKWNGGTFVKESISYAMMNPAYYPHEGLVKTFDRPNYVSSIKLPHGWRLFAEALDQLPATAIRRCTRCGHFYYKPTDKRKKYCNHGCQSAAAVERFRSKQQEQGGS